MKSTPRSEVLGLYRALLREAHRLPDPLVGFAFSNHIRDRFRKNRRIQDESLRYRKIKTGKQKLRQLQAANAQDKAAVAQTLRFAYGASGPLRHFNLTTYKRSGDPPNLNEARPPPFPPALRALLASPLARTKSSLRTQPDEPADLLLALDKRGWLGKLPERRERNLWWNWWREEPTKTLVPTEIQIGDGMIGTTAKSSLEPTASTEDSAVGSHTPSKPNSKASSTSFYLRQLGLPVTRTQEAGLARRAEEYARNCVAPKPPRRSVERTAGSQSQRADHTSLAIPPQSRFIRRRYRDLLSKMPMLSFKPASSPPLSSVHAQSKEQQPSLPPTPITAPGKFDVSISSLATTQGSRNRTTYSVMRQEDREWVERAQQAKNPASPKSEKPELHLKSTWVRTL